MKRFSRGPALLAQGLLALGLMACSTPLAAQRATPPTDAVTDVAASTVTDTEVNPNADTRTTDTGAEVATDADAASVATDGVATGDIAAGATSTPLVTVNAPAVDASTAVPASTESASTAGAIAQAAPVAPLSTTAEVASAEVASADVAALGYANVDSPVDLLASYYDAINHQEYERAYSYWSNPPLPFDQFASGYGDTASVQLIVQPPTRIEGAAGSLYAAIPTFLVAQHYDGSVHSFAGCIVTRKSNLQPPDIPEPDVWHLYQATLSEVDNNVSIPAQLAGACEP